MYLYPYFERLKPTGATFGVVVIASAETCTRSTLTIAMTIAAYFYLHLALKQDGEESNKGKGLGTQNEEPQKYSRNTAGICLGPCSLDIFLLHPLRPLILGPPTDQPGPGPGQRSPRSPGGRRGRSGRCGGCNSRSRELLAWDSQSACCSGLYY